MEAAYTYEVKPVGESMACFGFRPGLLSERINKYGWDPSKAIETEVRGARS